MTGYTPPSAKSNQCDYPWTLDGSCELPAGHDGWHLCAGTKYAGGERKVIEYDDWLNTDDPRYVCIVGDCPKLVLPQGVIHSMQCRDANLKADAL